MNNESSAAEDLKDSIKSDLTREQVAEYLRLNNDFFHNEEDLLADLSLPHESGKAISLLEKQVTLLRNRGIETRKKLGDLLQNARNNDHLFDTTKSLVLSLLRAKNITEITIVAQDQLSNHQNIEACEVILIQQQSLNTPKSVRLEPMDSLKNDFGDVFRLKRTYCGSLSTKQITHLFPVSGEKIHSTAICPVMNNGEILALIALGNQTENYFNIHLDTLFLDFIGNVVGVVLSRHL